MEEPTDTLAQRLKLARTKRKLSQMELAAAANVTQSDVSKLERGKALATSSIARLSRALGVPPGWLEENQGLVPDWDAPASSPPPLSLSEEQMLERLRPEWRELILAYEELLPSDREALVKPMLDKATDARRYVEAAMAKQGVQYKPLRTTGNHLPLAPRGEERRQVVLGRTPERRTDHLVPSPLTHNPPIDAPGGKKGAA